MKTLMKRIVIGLVGIFLFAEMSYAQDSLRSVAPFGGRWFSGDQVNFVTVGQPAAMTIIGDASQIWTGSIGFVTQERSIGNNNPPVAIVPPSEVFLETNEAIRLEGFDPEGDAIEFIIESEPSNGSITLVSGTGSDYVFTPNSDLVANRIYSDSVLFKVREIGSGRASALASYLFSFRFEDEVHNISGFDFDGSSSITLSWTDNVPNESYTALLSYYDLSDPTNPVFRTLTDQTIDIESLSVTDGVYSLNVAVNSSNDPYLFDGDQVFVTALLTTDGGNSDFESYVINNSAGGRIEDSEDGAFFAFGSNRTVAENKTVELNMVAVELGDFDVSETTLEIIRDGNDGSINSPTISKTDDFTQTWVMSYTSTKEVGSTDEIEFRVFNPERDEFDTASFTIQIVDVNDQPKIGNIGNRITNEEQPITIDVSINDPDNEVDVLVESNQSTAVEASYSNGQITVTPGLNYSGIVSINVVATELNSQEKFVAFKRFNVEVLPVNDPPVVKAISNKTINEDNALNLVLSATDPDAAIGVFSFTANGSDPSALDISINGNDMVISPKANVNGSFTISVVADDRLGLSTSKSAPVEFELIVTPVNDAPKITKNIGTQRILDGLPDYNLDLSKFFKDVDNQDLTFSASGNTEVELSFAGSTMTVSTTDNFNTSEDVTITASDGSLSVSQLVVFIPLTNSPEITVANPVQNVELEEDFGTFELDVSNVFVDANNENAVFTYELIGANAINATISSAGIITFESADEFSGSESLFLIGETGGVSQYDDFSLSVTAVNDPPELNAIAKQTTNEDETISNIFIPVTDVDNTIGELTISATSSNQSLVEDASISTTVQNGGFGLSIVPQENAFGNVLITVEVSDGSSEVSTNVDLSIQSLNDEPVLVVTDIDDATEDSEYQLDLSTLFSDIESDVLTYTVVQKPDWTSRSGNLLSGTPTNRAVGQVSFSISASDGDGGTAIANYEIAVTNVNDAPELVSATADITVFQENEWNFSFPTTSFKDVDVDDELTFTFENVPGWVTISDNVLSGTPKYEDIGEYTFTLKATDLEGASVSDDVILTVEFTAYDVEISTTSSDGCINGRYTVEGLGAVSYNWFDAEGNEIASGKTSVDLDGGAQYFVEGLDSEGRATPEQQSFTLDACPLSLDKEVIVSVYPNPSKEWMEITSPNKINSLEVFDAIGHSYTLKSSEIENGFKLNVESLSNGLYFIRVKNETSSVIKKFIKK